MYHVKDGLYFERLGNGAVKIEVQDEQTGIIERYFIMDPDTWASVVASVCAKGENADTVRRAGLFHESGRHEFPER